MKYVSLVGVSAAIGSLSKNAKAAQRMCCAKTDRLLEDGFTPFITMTELDGSQLVCTLQKHPMLRTTNTFHVYDRMNILNSMRLYPVLEMQWLRGTVALSDEYMKMMDQLSYMYIAAAISRVSDDAVRTDEDWLVNVLKSYGAIVDVDEATDVPKIVMNQKLVKWDIYRNKPWQLLQLYGDSSADLILACCSFSQVFEELMLHMPLIFSMFMAEAAEGRIKGWPKGVRLNVETKLKQAMDQLAAYRTKQDGQKSHLHTYCLTTYVTAADMGFVRDMLMDMAEKIEKMNEDMGIISYAQYENAGMTHSTKSAYVRLTGMDIRWDDEMARAEREKRAAAEIDGQDGGTV